MDVEKIQKVSDTLKKIKELQEELSSCSDDKRAIEIQINLMGVIADTFKDKDFLNILSKKSVNLKK